MGVFKEGSPILSLLCNDLGVAVPPSRTGLLSAWRRARSILESRKDLIYGAAVATQSLFLALLKCQTETNIALVALPDRVPIVKQQLTTFEGQVRKQVVVHSYYRLEEFINNNKNRNLTWLDPYGSSFANPFDIRYMLSNYAYPVALLHHSLSYQEHLNDNLMPLLLSETLLCDSVICSSKASRELILRLIEHMRDSIWRRQRARVAYSGRTDIIPLGVDTTAFFPRPKAPCRRRFGLPQKAVIILYFGRIAVTDKADLFPLLQTCAEIQRRVRDKEILLVIAGRGHLGYEHLLQKALAEANLSAAVQFITGVTHEQKATLYSAADVFVSPSDNIQECFGLTPIEAMASGIPQVVSDWDGYRDTVSHGETGFRIPTYWTRCDSDLIALSQVFPKNWETEHFRLSQSVAIDLKDFLDKLESLVKNDDLRNKMSEASRKRAIEQYDWHVIIRQYLQLFGELNAIAATIPYTRRREPHYRSPLFFDNFSHFATKILDDATVLVCSERGKRTVLDGGIYVPYMKGFEGIEEFSRWSLTDTLRYYREPMAIGASVRRIISDSNCAEDCARRQVMWLLKYGYLEIQKG